MPTITTALFDILDFIFLFGKVLIRIKVAQLDYDSSILHIYIMILGKL